MRARPGNSTRVALPALLLAGLSAGGYHPGLPFPLRLAAARAQDSTALRAALAEGQRAYARRGDPAALDEAITAFRRAAALAPGDPASELPLARAWAFKGLSARGPAEARDAWDASARAAERALRRLAPGWAEAIDRGEPAGAAAVRVEAPGAEALYWLALGSMRRAQATGVVAVLAAKDAAVPMMERAAALDEVVDAAGPHRALGAWSAALPVAAGGGVAGSRKHFERARELFPHEQLGRVLEAETYAVLVQDSGLFDRLLAEVIAFQPARWPERAPENMLAQRLARELQARRARLF